MKEWPKDGSVVSVDKLIDPIIDAIKSVYALDRVNVGFDAEYNGYKIGKHERATCIDADERFTAEFLEHESVNGSFLSKSGKEALTEFVYHAFLLGVEQGRRVETSDNKERNELLILQKAIELFEKTKDKVPNIAKYKLLQEFECKYSNEPPDNQNIVVVITGMNTYLNESSVYVRYSVELFEKATRKLWRRHTILEHHLDKLANTNLTITELNFGEDHD